MVLLVGTYMKPLSKRARRYGLFLCECGEQFEYDFNSARNRAIQKCNKCQCKSFLCMDNKSEYRSWQHMKERCYNKNFKRYADWGGRGIKVCESWLESFENFLNDMGKKPSQEKYKYSIDRIDNDGDYTKENCRWATAKQQNTNKRNTQ